MLDTKILFALERSIPSLVAADKLGRFEATAFAFDGDRKLDVNLVRDWFAQRRRSALFIYSRVGRINVEEGQVTVHPIVSSRQRFSLYSLPLRGDHQACLDVMTAGLTAHARSAGRQEKSVVFFEFSELARFMDIQAVRSALARPMLFRQGIWCHVSEALVDHYGVIAWYEAQSQRVAEAEIDTAPVPLLLPPSQEAPDRAHFSQAR